MKCSVMFVHMVASAVVRAASQVLSGETDHFIRAPSKVSVRVAAPSLMSKWPFDSTTTVGSGDKDGAARAGELNVSAFTINRLTVMAIWSLILPTVI